VLINLEEQVKEDGSEEDQGSDTMDTLITLTIHGDEV
jgi:hypothetical protein